MAEKNVQHLRCCRVELDVKKNLVPKIYSSLGTLRFVYNLYIAKNQEDYEKAVEEAQPGFFEEKERVLAYNKGKTKKERLPVPKAPKVDLKPMRADHFYTWLKEVYIKENPDKKWINETHSKAIKQTITDAYNAFKKFLDGKAGYPKFKKKHDRESSYYFVRNGKEKQPIEYGRHYIVIPGIGRLHFKEKGRIPGPDSERAILSGRLTVKNGRMYVSVLVIYTNPHLAKYAIQKGVGNGVDLGVKSLAVTADGHVFKNINKSRKMKRLERQLKHHQRHVSRKTLALKERQTLENSRIADACSEGKKTSRLSSRKLNHEKAKVARLHERMERIRTDYRKKVVHELVKDNPEWITIEDLNVSGMMKNRHLAKAIAEQQFYAFKRDLAFACQKRGIELRLANRFYASSKICHECGYKKKDLKLKEREWTCPECHHHHDRDLNAAENLRDTNDYTVYSLNSNEGSRNKNITIMI